MIIKKGKKQITFVYIPENGAQRVEVAGDFNDWQPEQGKMLKQKDGSYRRRFDLTPGEHRYKFRVDGNWIEDRDAERLIPNEFGTYDSLVTVG